MRLVLVEDDTQLARLVAEGLREEGYEVGVVDTVAKALERGFRGDLNLMILDLGLPDRDGIEVLQALRGAHIHVPVLVLTARDAVGSRVLAFEAGADDYIIKPFAFAELIARIDRLMRRATGPRWAPANALPITLREDLVIEASTAAGVISAALSPREFALFGYLWRRPNEVVSREEILREAFGCKVDPGTNIIDVHLAHLRKKLTGFPIAIETVRGAGLRIVVANV